MGIEEPDGLLEWAAQVPEVMRADPIWRLPAYRYALYLADLVQNDVPKIRANLKTRSLTDQLVDAVGSISANIAEGYSRTTGPERAKFFEYAQSSARESARLAVQSPARARSGRDDFSDSAGDSNHANSDGRGEQ